MPSETELPRGKVREFVEVLHSHYRAAHRPPLRKISEKAAEIAQLGDGVDGTASRETVRRMLLGQVLPLWSTVEVVFLALCALARRSPDEQVSDEGYGSWTFRDEISSAWNDAVDAPPARRESRAASDDPWATSGNQGSGWNGGYSEEPPF
jgi:hypothetical protein